VSRDGNPIRGIGESHIIRWSPSALASFKAKVCRLCDEKDWTWLIEGTNVLSDHLQVIVAVMTATPKRSADGMSTDFSKFSKEAINEVAKKLKDSQAQSQLKVCLHQEQEGHIRGTLHGS
jgi:hypothetical protein